MSFFALTSRFHRSRRRVFIAVTGQYGRQSRRPKGTRRAYGCETRGLFPPPSPNYCARRHRAGAAPTACGGGAAISRHVITTNRLILTEFSSGPRAAPAAAPTSPMVLEGTSTPPARRRRDRPPRTVSHPGQCSARRASSRTYYNLHKRPSGGSVSFGDDESSTVSSTVPPPCKLISFFVTYRRSGGAHPTHKIRFWRVGQGWSWGTCLRVHCERRPAH